MSPRTAGLGLLLLVAACAGTKKQTVALNSTQTPGLYVGHSQAGEVVVAASHYKAMNGLAVAAADLGITPGKGSSEMLLCEREVITGSHVPHWFCRYQDDIDQSRAEIQQELILPHGSTGRALDGTVTPK